LSIEAVTFDCAQTLIAVDWRPAILAVESAASAGIEFDQTSAAVEYDNLLRKRWHDFRELNLSRDESLADAFWLQLTADWAATCGFSPVKVCEIIRIANDSLYGAESTVFSMYSDVIECLTTLKSAGIRLAVVSNWDISLHKTLRAFGIYDFFETVTASMEEGVEKPDPKIFEITLDRMQISPEKVVHVGDNPIDDLRGAKSAGIKGYIIDRENPSEGNLYISSLSELPKRIGI